MKEWRISLVNARLSRYCDLKKAKQLSDVLTVATLEAERRADPEAWGDLKRLIAKAEQD